MFKFSSKNRVACGILFMRHTIFLNREIQGISRSHVTVSPVTTKVNTVMVIQSFYALCKLVFVSNSFTSYVSTVMTNVWSATLYVCSFWNSYLTKRNMYLWSWWIIRVLSQLFRRECDGIMNVKCLNQTSDQSTCPVQLLNEYLSEYCLY
jgi:hypothetical protein